MVRNYLDGLTPVPTVTGPAVTCVTVPDDAMRWSTTYNGNPLIACCAGHTILYTRYGTANCKRILAM